MALAQDVDPARFTGLTGWVAGVIDALGGVGVALLVALESIIPPIPSEIVLAMAGYLAAEGRFNVVLIVLAATIGSLLGALVLYWLGGALGEERLKRWLDRVPLVDRGDLERADRWFERHGRWAVLIGRVVPVVRSLVSIPAGANRMPLGEFVLLTTLGSGVWNGLIVGAGFALGSRWQEVDRYSSWFNYAILAAFVVTAAAWVAKKLRRRARRSGARAGGTTRAGTGGERGTPSRPEASGRGPSFQ
ncbi:DedA family protein [Micromonospora sp. NPDC048830]|uniref:DedA family protein n=1 Tax=Micromonospora sp. NPDC048830 TaxID=3364257 RepID=UPI003718FCDE